MKMAIAHNYEVAGQILTKKERYASIVPMLELWQADFGMLYIAAGKKTLPPLIVSSSYLKRPKGVDR